MLGNMHPIDAACNKHGRRRDVKCVLSVAARAYDIDPTSIVGVGRVFQYRHIKWLDLLDELLAHESKSTWTHVEPRQAQRCEC